MPLTHFDAEGKARMVDVTEKKETVREATATGKIKVSRDVYDAIEAGTVGKGDVLSVATTAGIMGVKRTADLIPMCHILPITNCKIRFEKDPKNLEITCFCTVKVTGKTGVEMEALTGVSVALLTIYDMCKALDKFMEIQDIYPESKYRMEARGKMKAAVVTLSDKGFRNEREDKSGELVQMMLKEAGYEVAEYRLLPDEQTQIETVLKELSDEKEMDLILTTGGTGFSQRDCTPEATMNVATRNAPGIAEAMRYASLAITPRAMLSRGVSVIRNQTLIINLPGSPKAVKENLEYILPTLSHGLEILKGVTGECGISLKET